MIELKHSVNLVAKIDEHKMPEHLLASLLNLNETQMHKLLASVFIGALDEIGALEKVNENNAYALIEWGDN